MTRRQFLDLFLYFAHAGVVRVTLFGAEGDFAVLAQDPDVEIVELEIEQDTDPAPVDVAAMLDLITNREVAALLIAPWVKRNPRP